MKAYAYMETYSGGSPRYVLRFSLYDAIANKTGGEISHVDIRDFREILAEQRSKGVKIETSRMPFRVKSLDMVAIEDFSERVEVQRVPLDRV